MPSQSFNEENFWSDEFRTRAANNAYHSIDLLERLDTGWRPGQDESPEEVARLSADLYSFNLSFLKGVIDNPYYDGFIDRKRVQDAIAAAEANPVSTIS